MPKNVRNFGTEMQCEEYVEFMEVYSICLLTPLCTSLSGYQTHFVLLSKDRQGLCGIDIYIYIYVCVMNLDSN